MGTDTINSLNDNIILNPNQRNHIIFTEHDDDLGGKPSATRGSAATRLAPASVALTTAI